VQEIGDWLERLGMLEYGECFAENKIDLSVLPHLTDSRRPVITVLCPIWEWGVYRIAFNGDGMRQLSAQFLALAAKQRLPVPMMNGHRAVGISLVLTGDISEGRKHLDQAIALYTPAEHSPLATRFGTDIGTSILSYRSIALWLLGYPEAALADTDRALNAARRLGKR
jgi:SAM domain (Sterile alpha motif)